MPTANAFDLVIAFDFSIGVVAALQAALRPGGWLLYQTFQPSQAGPDSDFPREYLLDVGELLRAFAGWKIIEAGDDGGPSATNRGSFAASRTGQVNVSKL